MLSSAVYPHLTLFPFWNWSVGVGSTTGFGNGHMSQKYLEKAMSNWEYLGLTSNS